MASFADFAFYTEQGGKLTEAAYNASVGDAYQVIVSQTNGRAVGAPELMQSPVKLCECALVDVLAGYRETESLLPKGVATVSNDSFSVSTGSANGKTLVQAKAEECASVCAQYLQWPINLMCRWL